MSNFGFYASPERNLVFDLNDFDETLPGPFEWDVKRLAASVEIASRSQSFRPDETRRNVLESVRGYREAMRAFAAMGNQALWYARLDAERFLAELRGSAPPEQLRRAERLMSKAPTRTSMQAFSKLTHVVTATHAVDLALVVPGVGQVLLQGGGVFARGVGGLLGLGVGQAPGVGEQCEPCHLQGATAAELNCSAACTSGVWSVIPACAAANSASACCTRATVAGGSAGSLGASLVSASGGSPPAALASAAARASWAVAGPVRGLKWCSDLPR